MAQSPFIASLRIMLVLAAGYFAAGKAGLALAFVHPSATAVWPPTGIALAAFLALGYWVWPSIFLGAFLVNITTAGSAATSLGIAAGNTLEGLAGAYLVRRFANGTAAFDRPQDVFKFAGLAAMVSTTVSATFGVTGLSLGGYADWAHYGFIWLTWWLGDAVGDLIVAPLLLLWAANPRIGWNRAQALEAVLLLLSLLVVGEAVFWGWLPIKNYPLEFLCIPIVVWAGFRLGRREAVTATFLLSGIAIWGTLSGFGPFAGETPNTSLLLLQAYMGVVALMALTPAAAVLERNQAEAALRDREQRLSAAFRQPIVGIAQCELTGRFVLVNRRYCEIAGRSRDELLGLRIQDITYPDDLPRTLALLARVAAGDPGLTIETRYVRPDGSDAWVNNSVSPMADPDGIMRYTIIALDITDRRRAEEELRKSEATARAFLESAGESILIADGSGCITGVNAKLEVMFDYKREEVIGQPVELLISERLRSIHAGHRASFLSQPRTRPMGLGLNLAGRRKDGTEFPVEISLSYVKTEEGIRVIAFITDITDRRRIEQERDQFLASERAARAEAEAARRRVAFLAEASNVLASSLDYKTTLDQVARLSVLHLADLCLIDLIAEDGSIRRVAVAHANPAKEYLARELLSLPPDRAGSHPVAKVLRSGRSEMSLEITDSDLEAITQSPEHLNIVRELGCRSNIVVPLIARGRTLGVLSLVSASAGRYGSSDLALTEDLAHRAALAVDNSRLFSESAVQRGEAQALAEIGQALAQLLDPREVSQRIVEKVRELFGAQVSVLYRLEPASETLSALAVSGARALVDAQEIVPIAPVSQAVRTRRTVFTPNVLTDPGIVLTREARERLSQTAYRAVLAAPLLVGDRVVGALALGDHAGRVFDDTKIRLIRVFANQAAMALETARLFEEAEQRRREAEVLAEVTRSTSGSLDPDVILRRVVEGAKELCRCDMASVAMRDPETERMIFRHGAGTPWGSMRVTQGKGQVFARGSLQNESYAPDPRADSPAPVSRADLVISELAVPIRIEDRTEGVLYAARYSSRQFTRGEEAILTRLADHATLAIRNAQLYAASEQRRQKAERLAELAARISASLKPAEVAQRITDSARTLLKARNVILYRVEPESGGLVTFAFSGEGRPVTEPDETWPKGVGLVDLAVREGRSVATSDLLNDSRVQLPPELRVRVEQDGLGSVLAIPLVAHGRVIGVLRVADRTGRVFDHEEIQLAETFADYAAIAQQRSYL